MLKKIRTRAHFSHFLQGDTLGRLALLREKKGKVRVRVRVGGWNAGTS